jgi:hypothetical protein
MIASSSTITRHCRVRTKRGNLPWTTVWWLGPIENLVQIIEIGTYNRYYDTLGLTERIFQLSTNRPRLAIHDTTSPAKDLCSESNFALLRESARALFWPYRHGEPRSAWWGSHGQLIHTGTIRLDCRSVSDDWFGSNNSKSAVCDVIDHMSGKPFSPALIKNWRV